MNQQLHIIVPGQPVAKGRHRSPRNSHAYTPEKTRIAEVSIGLRAKIAMGCRNLFSGALRIEILFAFEIPVSWPNAKRAQALEGEIPHTGKPDLDNLIKLVNDACNKVVWNDDSQVIDISAKKIYSRLARTEIVVSFA